jgi:pimeloyl-ACP methyl ester carboxylesterase
MKYADVGGFRIAYRREGGGEPMVLIHGITTYSFLWRKMMPFLSREYDVMAPDLLGCGDSSKPLEADHSIAAQADLVLELMDSLGIGRAHLVGHDIGGGVAQIMAVREPERFLSLAFINSVAYDYWPVQPIITMRIPILRIIAMAALDMGVFRKIVERAFYHRGEVTDELMKAFQQPLGTPEGRRGFLNLAAGLDNSQLMSIADDLPSLPMPVLIVRGEADIFLKPYISERLHREIKGSRYETIATAGHFSPLDEPRKVADLVLESIKAAIFQTPSS